MILHKLINYDLKIKEDFYFLPLFKDHSVQRIFDLEKILFKEDIEYFENIGCKIREINLFYTKPMSSSIIHIDGFNTDRAIGAVNKVLLDQHSNWEMQWFTIKNKKKLDQLISSGNTAFMPLDENDCELFEKCNYNNQPYLVRVDVPHKIVNLSNNTRYCISIRFINNDFHRLIDIFK